MMHEKALSVLTLDVDELNLHVKFLITSLKSLHWRVHIQKVLPQDSRMLCNEIERNIKQYQICILIGEYTNVVAKSLSNVFHQSLRTVKFGQIPMHARFLDNQENSVLYIQGLLVIPVACDVYRIFEDILKPFLTNVATRNYRSAVVINSDMGTVLRNSKLEFFSEVYGFRRFDHVRKSIENIEKCLAHYHPDNIFISFNGGKDCTVLLHMTIAVLMRNYPEYSKKLLCLYIENTDSFKEISDFVVQCETYYSLDVVRATKNTQESLTDVLHNKPNLKACLMGTRRTDPFSEHLEIFQMTDPDWPQVVRVSPLLDWHYSEIWDYLLSLKVPYCKLYDMGYTSLGNVNNTVKNPLLLYEETYLPAYKLLDASQERLGRRVQPVK